MVKLYTRQSLHTTTQLLQGCSGTRAKIWSNYTQDKVYTLQHSYSKAPVELEPKLVTIIHKTKSTYYNKLLQGSCGTRAKIWSNYTQDKVYTTTTQLLQGCSGTRAKYLVKLYTRQSLHITTQLLQGCSGTRAKIWSNYTQDKVYILQHSYSKAPVEQEPKFGQIKHKTKSTYYNTATPRLQLEQEPKFGQIIHKT